MQAALDPYTPGSGKPPQALIGRDNDIDALDTLIVRAARGLGPARPLLLTGLRGVGKTVLLNAMMDRVTEADWFAVKIEASSGRAGAVRARRAIAAGLVRASMAYKARSALAAVGRMLSTVSSFSVSLGIDSFSLGVERDPVRASTGNLDLDFQDVVADVSRVLGEERVAFAILVDEMQDLDGELLAALITTQHEASQRNWNFYVIGAGLPSLPGRLATAKSYAERMFLVRQIGRLSDAESRRVLVEPAERMGARFEEEALTHLVRISGRYPYFLQEFGSAIWRTSPRSPFTGADARRAEAVGLAQLDAMFFSSRWERITPAEREYLGAMAEEAGESTASAAIAVRLNRSVQSLGPARANLISKGLIYVPQRGRIAFTVPGFGQYIAREMARERG
ncbi:ATP-binding protein [Actinomyces dentalis]|jgi:hypothetical protein|uniref:ATP-binding protein n=1 Tax=Actinomyces dentalis TaxID=272548 RepID=UPI000403886A|nr:ATP-binding protein [Actinomyces dentalis]